MPPDPARDPAPTQARRSTRQRPRDERVAAVAAATTAQGTDGTSQRQFARDHGIPRATLQGWCHAAGAEALEDPQRQFLESPTGLALLHRILLAALVVMVLRGGLGVSQVRLFLTLSGLHTVLACSETTLRRRMTALVRAVVVWGTKQDQALAASMPPRTISVAVDETHHGGMMLVALEMVSGFLLVETRSALRDGATWATALKARLATWPVTVVQLVADEARGLWKLARTWLRVAKVADLFHGQYELTRGVLSAAHRRVGAITRCVEAVQERRRKLTQARTRYDACGHGPGRPPDWQGRAERLYDALGAAQAASHGAAEQAAALGRAVRDLGVVLHPIDPTTGALQTAAQVGAKLTGIFEEIWQRAAECELGTRAQEAVSKAQRLVPTWVEALTAWHRVVAERVAARCDDAQARLVREVLIPVRYLQRELRRASTRLERRALRERIVALSAPLHAADSLWRSLSAPTRSTLERLAQDCVDLYQRASSCVEGRNGYLALRHHQRHALSDEVLRALTVVHNYMLQRADGTTAAERFFGQSHDDLFEHLCTAMPLPARPRRRAKRPVKDPLAVAS